MVGLNALEGLFQPKWFYDFPEVQKHGDNIALQAPGPEDEGELLGHEDGCCGVAEESRQGRSSSSPAVADKAKHGPTASQAHLRTHVSSPKDRAACGMGVWDKLHGRGAEKPLSRSHVVKRKLVWLKKNNNPI